jgi:hypothetical protein
MAKDMVARQLIKQVPPLDATLIDVVGQTAQLNYGEGWEIVLPSSGGLVFVWRGFIDLAGYTQDDLTFFTQAVDIQNANIPAAVAETTSLNVTDLITTRFVPDTTIFPNNIGNTFLNPAAIPTLDIQEMIYGEWRTFTPYTATNLLLRLFGTDTFGTGNPTASARIHITRIVTWNGTGSTGGLNVPAYNVLMGGVTAHEKDLVYIERLRRAYTQERTEP